MYTIGRSYKGTGDRGGARHPTTVAFATYRSRSTTTVTHSAKTLALQTSNTTTSCTLSLSGRERASSSSPHGYMSRMSLPRGQPALTPPVALPLPRAHKLLHTHTHTHGRSTRPRNLSSSRAVPDADKVWRGAVVGVARVGDAAGGGVEGENGAGVRVLVGDE